MMLRPKELISALKAAQAQGVSMRRRLVVYLCVLMLFLALLLTVLLLLSGAIDPIGERMERTLAGQLERSADAIRQQSENQAAYAVALSRQLTAELRAGLASAGLTFEQLRNDPEALAAVESGLFDAVHDSMLRTPCSGALM